MVSSQEMKTLDDQLVASVPFTYSNPLPVLPYPNPAHHVICEHLCALSNSFSSFHTSTFPLTCVEGSICINNCIIDLSIWVPESYPHVVPVVYLSTSEGMVHVPKHEYMDTTGIVYIPCLTSWESTVSNLSYIVKQLEILFSMYHPFCSKPDQKDDPILEIAKSFSRDIYGNEMELKGLMQVQVYTCIHQTKTVKQTCYKICNWYVLAGPLLASINS
jgi:UEV domain